MKNFEKVINGEGDIIRDNGHEIKKLADWIKCADGTTLSVQASEFHYCTPRTNHGPYSTVEVGFPSIKPPLSWSRYIDESWDNWDEVDGTDTVYGYVPIDLVREFIKAHGGEL